MLKILNENTRLIKILALLLLLIVTFSIRAYYNTTTPVDKRHNYSYWYANSFKYAVGGLDLKEIKDPKIKKQVNDFIYSRVDKIDEDILKPYIKNNAKINNYLKGNFGGTFSFYVAAYVWKIFGVSWSNLFYFYSFFSTLACLALFFTVKKITGSYLGGFFTALAYTFATPEIYGGVWSLRDASPVWFFAFAVSFYFLFVGRFKNNLINFASYYLLGVITLVGIGWRVDTLLFFPIILIFLLVDIYKKYKNRSINLSHSILAIILFIAGSYSIMNLDKYLSSKNHPKLGAFQIALYGEDARSKLGQYENNFEYRVSDTVTRLRIEHYQKSSYPEDNSIKYIRKKYGVYAFELYMLAFKHNLYQWVASYPNYILEKYIYRDIRLYEVKKAKYSFSFNPRQKDLFVYLWSTFVFFALIGGLILLHIRKYRLEAGLLFFFLFYYSLIYWSVFPAAKHIIITSIPISILAGLSLFVLSKALRDKTYKKEVINAIKDKKNIKQSTVFILILVSIFIVLLIATNIYSKNEKSKYINKINEISINSIDISNKIQNNHIFNIDLKDHYQIGLMVEFESPKEIENNNVIVIKNKHLNIGKGQLIPTKYIYKFDNSVKENKLFTVCSKMAHSNDVTVILPKCANIKKVSLIPLNKWNGVQYTTVFNDQTISAGANSIADKSNAKLYTINRKSKLLHEFKLTDFEQKDELDIKNHSWNLTKEHDLYTKIIELKHKRKDKNLNSYINLRINKKSGITKGDLYVKVEFFDKFGKIIYITEKNKIKDFTINSYELEFDISKLPLSAEKFRLAFYGEKKGIYKLQKSIKVYQTDINCKNN